MLFRSNKLLERANYSDVTVCNSQAIRVGLDLINCHPAQSSKAGRIPHQIVVLQYALRTIGCQRTRFNELCFFNGKTTPLIAFLSNNRIFFNWRIFGGFTALNVLTNINKPHPLPALRDLKRHLQRRDCIPYLLIRGIIGTSAYVPLVQQVIAQTRHWC